MIPKPPTCHGCPLYGDGQGFVPDEIVPGARVAILAQNPGADEEREGRPMVGTTGQMMDREYLPLAQLERGRNVHVLNVLKCRWVSKGKRTNDLPPAAILKPAVTHCMEAHLRIPLDAEVVVCQGALAWSAMGGPGTISSWRGFTHPTRTPATLATLHLADLYRDPRMRLPTRQDWRKIPKLLAGTWPRPIPPSIVATTPQDIWAWVEPALHEPYLAVDTEFNPDTKWLWLWGVGGPTLPATLQVDLRDATSAVRGTAAEAMRHLALNVPVVYQNAMADLAVLEKAWGIGYADHLRVEDCMLLHALLWSELPHDLEFLASLYGQYPKLKHLAKEDPLAYHQGDLLATLDVWTALYDEVRADPATWQIYETQSLPLIPILLEAERVGIRVNRPRVEPELEQTRAQRERASILAQAYMGYPFNIGSNAQLQRVLYQDEGFTVRKHKDTKKPTINADAVAALRAGIDPAPDPDTETTEGLTWESAVERLEHGAHPLLEARVLYADALQVESHYLRPFHEAKDGRVYPRYAIHTQETGRWSITDPPLQQLPKDLRDCILPDEGEAWISWDWSGIEEVLLGALSGETTILEAVRDGRDLHAAQAFAIFGPKATGREDYRTFTKRFKYRLYYLGDPRSAANIPGARALGLGGPHLATLARSLLSTMPRLAQYRDRITASLARKPRMRTFMGRLRMALGSRGAAAVRELWNHQFQGGVADILNTTVIAIKQQCPWTRLVYTAHDAGTFAVPVARLDESVREITQVVCRPIDVNSRTVEFPAKFTLRYADGREEKG